MWWIGISIWDELQKRRKYWMTPNIVYCWITNTRDWHVVVISFLKDRKCAAQRSHLWLREKEKKISDFKNLKKEIEHELKKEKSSHVVIIPSISKHRFVKIFRKKGREVCLWTLQTFFFDHGAKFFGAWGIIPLFLSKAHDSSDKIYGDSKVSRKKGFFFTPSSELKKCLLICYISKVFENPNNPIEG